jgi:hypothetical protein
MKEQRTSARSIAASILLALSFGFAGLGAYCFEMPNLLGFFGENVLADADFWCVLGSFVSGLGATAFAFRHVFSGERPACGSILGGAVFGAGLSLLLFLVWVNHVFYYAFLLAPVHAFAIVGVVASWRRQQSEEAFRRIDFEGTRGPARRAR